MAEANRVPVEFRILGLSELKAANQQLKQMGSSSGNVARATRGTARFGNAAQNASYQVQDLIVQIQGGTDPMRALSQQLPQITVGMGAWGAAIGLVAAALPALIVAMRDTNDEAVEMSDAFDILDTSIGSLGKVVDAFDMSNWVTQFNEASEAQREFMRETLENDRLLAERAQRQAVSSIGFQSVTRRQDVSNIRSGVGRQNAVARANREAAEALGLSVEAYKELAPLYERVLKSQGQDQEAIKQLRTGLIDYNSTLSQNNEQLNEQIDNTWKLIQANDALAASRETARQAESVGGAGMIPGGEGSTSASELPDISTIETAMNDVWTRIYRARSEANKKSKQEDVKVETDYLNRIFALNVAGSKKGSKLQQGLSMARATMTGYEAIQAALAAPPGFPYNLGNVALVTAETLANISAIRSTSFEGGGYTGSGARTGGLDGRGGFPAMLHPNETVIDHERGGRTANVTFTINAMDARGVQDVLVEQRGLITNLVRQSLADTGRRFA